MRLLTFGCSLAYGHGLSDCFKQPYNEPGETASEQAFPTLVARKLNRQCINLSRPGASNKEIWTKAINYEYNIKDIVLVHWSYPDRNIIYKDNKTIELAPWNDNTESKLFYKHFHSENDANNDFYLRLDHLNSYYNRLNLKYLFFIPKFTYYAEQPNWCNAEISPYSLVVISQENKDLALDNKHPGANSHFEFARQIYHSLKIKESFN